MVGQQFGTGDDHLDSVRFEQVLLFFGHLVGDRADDPIAPHRPDNRQADSGISAGRFNNGAARSSNPSSSARSIMVTAMRSLIDPPTLTCSALATRLPGGWSRARRIRGVCPIASTALS